MRKTLIFIIKSLSKILTRLISTFPHKKRYFIFTSKYGFSDNTKYLFLYYLKQEKNCIWVASDDVCYTEVEEIVKNCPNSTVIKRNSVKLLFPLAKAKYVFVTHSFLDLGITAIKSCPVINLWHGIPIKKMGYDSKSDVDLFSLNLVNPYKTNDFLISSSETTKPFLISCMKIPSTKVLPLGQPRNDYLYDNKDNTELIKELKSHYTKVEQARVFLFAPTFRDKSNLSVEIYSNLINSFKGHSKEADVLVLRLHPKERELLESLELPYNVQLSLINDVQEELLAADIMISDYSSIIFDFSVLARPILLYTPDKEAYFHNRGGSYFEYDQILQECTHIKENELNRIWQTSFKTVNFTKLMSLHSLSASKAIYNRFN